MRALYVNKSIDNKKLELFTVWFEYAVHFHDICMGCMSAGVDENQARILERGY